MIENVKSKFFVYVYILKYVIKLLHIMAATYVLYNSSIFDNLDGRNPLLLMALLLSIMCFIIMKP